MKDEQIYTLALSRIPGLGLMGACCLVRSLGSASAVFQHRKELKEFFQLLPVLEDSRSTTQGTYQAAGSH